MRWNDFGRVWRLSIVLGAGMLAAISGSAFAEESGAGHTPPPPPPKVEVTIPTIESVGSSIDEAGLRDIFSGNVLGHAKELAELKASSIHIPELKISYVTPPVEGKAQSGEIVLRDIRLNKVRDGIAQAVIIGSAESSNSVGGVGKFGQSSAEDFNIAGLMEFFGLVKPDRPATTPITMYRKFISVGGTITAPEGDTKCTVGGSSIAFVKARPPRTSFADVMTIAAKADGTDEKPDPATLRTLVEFFTDIVEGFETSPMTVGGFDCKGADEDGKPIAVKIGSIDIGAFGKARYPSIVAHDMAIDAFNEGLLSLGEFNFKGFDLSGTLAALKSANGAFDDAWFEAHARELAPRFDGLAFSRFVIDIPAGDYSPERILGSIQKFDLTLKDYINAIPTNITTLAQHIVVQLPTESQDENVQLLVSYGIKKLDLGFDVGLKWDEASKEVRLGKFNVNGVDMGSIAASTVIGNATRDLFSNDLSEALAAAMGMTVKRVKVDMKDDGLADIIFTALAKEQHQDVADLRKGLAGVTQGTMLIFLGGAADTAEVTKAVGDFINGARSLSVSLTSKDPAGVPVGALEAAQDDPAKLLDAVTIKATAK